MGGFAARKSGSLLENMANISAIELLMAYNAVKQLNL
jgi:histidine ammonia-lyase